MGHLNGRRANSHYWNLTMSFQLQWCLLLSTVKHLCPGYIGNLFFLRQNNAHKWNDIKFRTRIEHFSNMLWLLGTYFYLFWVAYFVTQLCWRNHFNVKHIIHISLKVWLIFYVMLTRWIRFFSLYFLIKNNYLQIITLIFPICENITKKF